MPKINIKKFSRSKDLITEPPDSPEHPVEFDEEIIEPPTIKSQPKKRAPRPKKIKAISEVEPIPELELELEQPEQQQHEEEENIIEEVIEGVIDDSFLEDLNSLNYVEPQPIKSPPKEKQEPPTESESFLKTILKKTKKPKASKHSDEFEADSDNDGLFNESGSEIIGRDNRTLISKLNQYKNLFPKELSKFKVKKGANTEELKKYLEEAESIVETVSVDSFMTDSLLQCVKLVEGASTMTRYDVSGLSAILKANPQFHNLCKQLYVKYNVFNKIPIEYQMVMLIATTSYICCNKNKNKNQFENYLNEKI